VYNVAVAVHKRNQVTALKQSGQFPTAGKAIERRVSAVLRRLPSLEGLAVTVVRVPGLCDWRGPVHGAAFLRERRIALDCTVSEFPRAFVHELFHFVWLRAGNCARHSFEALLKAERRADAGGELGWSAEWRKIELRAADVRARNRRWREYCCESFCDTAAWLYAGLARHPEFTLPTRFRGIRREWFATFARRGLSI
jgi:hypothetical protein